MVRDWKGAKGYFFAAILGPGLYFWFFRVSCEEIFTREAQRGEAATKNRNISRKGAKAQSLGVEDPEKGSVLTLASLRLCGRHIRIRDSSITGKYAQGKNLI